MFKIQPILFYFLLFLIISCSSNKLSGSWEFIDIYDGEIRNTDTLKNKTNNSRYGTGILTFYQDKTFTSMGNSGTYQTENNLLKMKYNDDENVIPMKISGVSKNYLLLFSMAGSPKTWFYKKIKGKGSIGKSLFPEKQKIKNYHVFYCQKTKIFKNFNPIFVQSNIESPVRDMEKPFRDFQ